VADDEGDPVVRSPFVDDVAELFSDEPLQRPTVRALGAVGWDGDARTAALAGPRFAERVAQPLRHPEVVARLRDRPAWSASSLETWAGCPVKWFVERLLRPDEMEPDAEPLLRGDLAHKVLEQAVRRLVEGGALTPARLPEARAAVHRALEELGRDAQISVDPAREQAMRRRLEADLLRYVEAAAEGQTAFVPQHFEHEFEGLQIDGVTILGKIDRIDVRPGTNEAILVDYKGKSAPEAAKWLSERKFQLAVYALAARQLLQLEPVGALYQPLGVKDLRARGAVLEDADPARPVFEKDRLSREDFEQLLDEAVEAALQAAREARAGALEPRPETCAWTGGCAYPTICRCNP
jgi:RecB family exonuclease